jgi:hypothetical protein
LANLREQSRSMIRDEFNKPLNWRSSRKHLKRCRIHQWLIQLVVLTKLSRFLSLKIKKVLATDSDNHLVFGFLQDTDLIYLEGWFIQAVSRLGTKNIWALC